MQNHGEKIIKNLYKDRIHQMLFKYYREKLIGEGWRSGVCNLK